MQITDRFGQLLVQRSEVAVYLSSYFTRVTDVPSRMRLRSSTSEQLIVPSYNLAILSAGGPFQSPPPISGTVSLHISHRHRRSRFSGSVLRLFSSGAHILTKLSDTPCLHSVVDLTVTMLFRPH